MDNMEALVAALQDPETRENALLDLSKKRDMFADLAPILWHSFGVIPALLQEIVSIYPLLSPPSLTNHASNRVCNALALLQCVASHPDTRALFLNAHIPLFLYPFLNTVSKTRPFEYLRLTSLGVIGALVKVDDTDVINFLLSTEHPALPADDGARVGAVQDRGDVHCSEDPQRRGRVELHLCHRRKVLRGGDGVGWDGDNAG